MLVAGRSADVIFVHYNSLDVVRLSGASYRKLQDWAAGSLVFVIPFAVSVQDRQPRDRQLLSRHPPAA